MSGKQERKWVRPVLTVCVREQGESILLGCKMSVFSYNLGPEALGYNRCVSNYSPCDSPRGTGPRIIRYCEAVSQS